MNFKQLRNELAPSGVLRVAINLSNFLLVTGRLSSGEPEGVSPDIGREIAKRLGVPVKFVLFDTPGAVADAALDDAWDIANIGAEPERAKTISFTSAYVEIESTYLVPAASPIRSISEVDAPGHRIAVYARAAYGLWLIDHIRHAELVKTESMDASLDVFVTQGLDALAGLRPRLIKDAETLPGTRILDGQFSAVQQAIGTRPECQLAATFLQAFVEEVKSNGFVAGLIEKHGVTGSLTVAPFA